MSVFMHVFMSVLLRTSAASREVLHPFAAILLYRQPLLIRAFTDSGFVDPIRDDARVPWEWGAGVGIRKARIRQSVIDGPGRVDQRNRLLRPRACRRPGCAPARERGRVQPA